MYLPKIIETISLSLQKHHAKAIIVGGSVRDHFLQLPIKDYDIEVYGFDNLEQLEKILVEFGSVNLVGKSFGVLKFVHEKEEYDFSFPRLESKVGKGHRGFDVETDGSMAFEQAALRRDFTINAMGYDIEGKAFLDPFNAQEDIDAHLLRHIDDNSFVEDPLRVYRAVQFCARFGYELAPETKKLCLNMVKDNLLEELPKERIYKEFVKLLLKSPKPSLGFELMRELGILRYFPELEAIIDVPQDSKWHPEGDVWVHTMICIDAMVGLLGEDKKKNLKYMFAILCHDFGKATTTATDEDGCIRAIGHEVEGLEPTKSFMYRLTSEHDFIESILPLVEYHLKPSQFYAAKSKNRAIRKLATKVNIEELVIVAKAGFLGRTTQESLRGNYKAGEWLLEKAKALKVQNKPLDNLLQGRDLIDLGLEPSPEFKFILDEVYELQMEGDICTKEEALDYVKKYITKQDRK
ncbi:CCA tRNA nucleotidyltransferase [Sulfurovum sp. CS9]|uniref:CCA tRNA nucleotidyltransferase n=1 Tax=Sulfurovum sp. CS9 TaxID=3391146 RepID=UPI0039EA5A22